MTQDEYMNRIIQAYKKTSNEFSSSDKHTVELPNGYTGKAITMTATIESNEELGTAKGQAVFASGEKRIYDTIVFVKEDKYDPTESAIEDVIKSLTIEK